ncbi:SDR family oxidoreductase [soil metagenome]
MSHTWFITGTSTGFGRLLTEQLLDRGDRVAATLRRPEVLDDVKARYGEQLWIARLDVTDTAAVRQVVDQAFHDLGRIDVVVNNAGYGLFCAVEEAGDDQIRDVLDTNVIGSMQVIRAALPHLRAQGGGRILQVSSAGGQTTYPNFSYYHASKWAIEGFVETVAQEVAPFGIGMTIVEPGATGTSFAASLVTAPLMPEYDNTPAGDTRRAIADGSFELSGDPHKMVQAIISSTGQQHAPLRLALGKDTYTDVRASLTRRLEALEAQKAVALAAVVTP